MNMMISSVGSTISYFCGQMTEFGSSLCGQIADLAKKIFTVGVFALLVKSSPYIACISLVVGLAFPEYVMEKTALVFAGIFYLNKANIDDQTQSIWTKTKFYYDQYKPLIITGTIGFFALPVVTFPMSIALLSLRLGAYRGMQVLKDKTLFHHQWFYQASKQKQEIA